MSDEYKKGYKHGYADAMNWKVQNHLEHLPVAQPELTLDGLTPTEFALRELYEFQEATGCDTAAEFKAQPEQKPVALQMDVIVVNLVREGINKHRARELAEHFIKHTTPPQHSANARSSSATPRKPLTDQEIMNIAKVSCIGISPHEDALNFAKVIEAVHGIKGGA